MKKKEAKFKPREAGASRPVSDTVPPSDTQPNDEVTKAQSELVSHDKKSSVVTKLSAIWSILTTLYAIVTTGIFIGRGWISHVVSIVLVSILAVYICVFIVLIVFTFKDAKGGAKQVNIYRKTLKIFKAIANIVLLSLTAVSMVGMSLEGINQIAKLIFFIFTFIVGVIQLALKITMFVMKLIRMRIAKAFKVEYYRFVDGRQKKKGVVSKVKESRYKQK